MEKLTLVKVGGKIVEEKESLDALLASFNSLDGLKVLVHGGGRSATKIAEQLGISVQTVRNQLSQGLKEIRRLLSGCLMFLMLLFIK